MQNQSPVPHRKSKKQKKGGGGCEQRSFKGKATTGKSILKWNGVVFSPDISFKRLEKLMLKWNIVKP